MKQVDEQGLDEFLAEREGAQILPTGTFFQGTVTAIRGSFPNYDVQVRRTGESGDGHWHKCATPGYTPALGDLVDLVKRDDTFSHVIAPLSPNAFVSQGLARLAPSIVLSAPVASVSFSSIPRTFTHLFGSWRARCSVAGFNALNVRLNNDASNSYDVEIVTALNATVTGVFVTNPQVRIGGVGTTGGSYDSGWFYVHDYAVTGSRRLMTWQGWRNDGGGVGVEWGAADWQNTTDPVTSLTFLSSGGSLEAGCIFNLYGI